MPIDPSIPKDNDLISTFPAAIREARQVVADYASGDTPLEGITVEHPVGSSTFVTAEELACVSGVASNIQDQIDGKDPAGTAAGLVSTHASSSDHDGRYYTETEVNTLLSGKADVTQLHNAVTVTDTTSINLTLTGQALSADAVFGTTSGTVAQGSDSRFVTNGDSHNHTGGAGAQIAYSSLSGLPILHNPVTIADTSSIKLTLDGQQIAAAAVFGVSAGTVCQGNDSRLSDARTPTAHATVSHSDWPAAVSMVKVGYLDEVTSSIQTQINSKEPNFTTLPISKGGTGSSAQNFVDLTTDQSIAGNKTFTNSIATAGNLSFTGTGNRITGDFSNTTIANRVMFQTSTVNANTLLGSVPNGTATTSSFRCFNASDPNNSGFINLVIGPTTGSIISSKAGTGTTLPLSFGIGDSAINHCVLSTAGNFLIKSSVAGTDDDGVNKLQVTGSQALSGNLNFTGTGNRITGDFSNTALANRVMFQSSVTNGTTSMYSLPNGTATAATYQVLNSSDPSNTSRSLLGINAALSYVASQTTGTGTLLPLSLRISTTDHLLLSTNGNIVVKTAAAQVDDDSSAKLQVSGGIKSDTLKLTGLPVYADNVAALAGGLTTGETYRTATGVLMVVY